MAEFEIIWQAPEFEYHEKDISWYWISIIVSALIIAFSIWERNFLFGFFIVVAEILVILWANQEPRIISFMLDNKGLYIGEHKFHAYKEFESWSADDQGDGIAELGFTFSSSLRTPLKVMAPSEILEEVRQNLKPLLREVEHQLSLIESIEKLLRF